MRSFLLRPLAVIIFLLLGLPGRYSWLPSAAGQAAPPTVEDKVYTYTEQMPTLLGSTTADFVAAVQQRLVVPAGTPVASHRVFTRFTVGKDGKVENPEIVASSTNPIIDAAVLAAVRQLPTFQPGKQNGSPVRVSLTLAITPPGLVVPAPEAPPTGEAAQLINIEIQTLA